MELAREYDTLQDLGATVLAVSTDDLSKAKLIAEKLDLPFPILYNSDAEVVRSYDVYDLLGDGVAAPATFIIDKDGVIRWKQIGRNIGDRADAEEVIAELRAIQG